MAAIKVGTARVLALALVGIFCYYLGSKKKQLKSREEIVREIRKLQKELDLLDETTLIEFSLEQMPLLDYKKELAQAVKEAENEKNSVGEKDPDNFGSKDEPSEALI